MRKIIKKMLQKQSGQALVEFAVVIPIFLLIIIGIIGVGYMLVAEQVVTYAAREGARIGAQTNKNDQINGAIEAAMKAFDNNYSRTTIMISPAEETSPDRVRGKTLSVSVAYTVPFTIPLINNGEIIKVNAESLARIEYDDSF